MRFVPNAVLTGFANAVAVNIMLAQLDVGNGVGHDGRRTLPTGRDRRRRLMALVILRAADLAGRIVMRSPAALLLLVVSRPVKQDPMRMVWRTGVRQAAVMTTTFVTTLIIPAVRRARRDLGGSTSSCASRTR